MATGDTTERERDRPGLCESCARDDDDLLAVHRVYVVPESWDTPGSSTTSTDVELWCYSCREQYPNEPVEDGAVDEAEKPS